MGAQVYVQETTLQHGPQSKDPVAVYRCRDM